MSTKEFIHGILEDAKLDANKPIDLNSPIREILDLYEIKVSAWSKLSLLTEYFSNFFNSNTNTAIRECRISLSYDITSIKNYLNELFNQLNVNQ